MWNFIAYYGLISIKLVMAIVTAAIFLKFFNTGRQLKQMTPLDIILNFLLSAILSNFILDSSITIIDFAVIVLIYGVLLYLINFITFQTSIGRRIFVGVPKVIIRNGEFDADTMKRLRINARDVAAAMRHQDIHSLKDVKTAQIEPNGTLTVIKKGQHQYPIILIDNGIIVPDALIKINRTEKWLLRQLKIKKIADPDDVFIAQWNNGRLQIIKRN